VLVSSRIAARDADDVDIHGQRLRDLNVAEHLEHVTRDERQLIAWLDLAPAAQARRTVLGFIIGRVVLAVDGLLALKRRVQERVANAIREPSALPVDTEL